MDTNMVATALENTIYFIAVSTSLIWMNLKLFEVFADKLFMSRWRKQLSPELDSKTSKYKWNRMARRHNQED